MQTLTLPRASQPLDARIVHAAWYVAGAVVGFLLPFVFSSVLDLPNDAYYAVYFAGVFAFLTAYVTATRLDIRDLFTRNWRWSLGLGVIASAFLVFNILSREDATPHPDGLYFAFTIAWRGVLYGVVDALLLSAFPAAVAFALLGGRIQTLGRRVLYAAVTLALVLVITATYHLGYEQFRDDGVTAPETGNTIISVPAILTANPLGSLVAHASMHITADIHVYETDTFLPPQTTAD